MLALAKWRRGTVTENTLTCSSLSEIGSTHVAAWRTAGSGTLRWNRDTYEIRWSDGGPLVSGGAGPAQREVVAAAIRGRCALLAKALLHPVPNGIRDIRLNGALTFHNDPKSRIVCRHLAAYWLNCFFEAGHRGPNYARDFTHSAIGAQLGKKYDFIFLNAKRCCPIQYASNAEWGRLLQKRFETMRKKRESMTGYLIVTPVHAMAAVLLLQDRASERPYRVCFYEPSETATHQEMAMERTDRLVSLHGADVTWAASPSGTPPRPAQKAFEQSEAMLWFEVGPLQMQRLNSMRDIAPPVLRSLAGPLPPLNAETMCYLVRHDCVDTLHRLTAAFRRLPEPERLALLAGPGPTTLFYGVMWHGHPDTVAAFGRLIEDLPIQTRATLLESRCDVGRSAFGAALLSRRREMILPFWTVVKRLLPPELHYRLMRAEEANGISSLFWPMLHDDMPLLSEYVAATVDLPDATFVRLMQVKGPDGRSGLLSSIADTVFHPGKMAEGYGIVLDRLPQDLRLAELKPVWDYLQSPESASWKFPWIVASIRRHVEKYAPALLPGQLAGASGPQGTGAAIEPAVQAGRKKSDAIVSWLLDAIGIARRDGGEPAALPELGR